MSRRRFEEMVADALDEIPPEFAAEMDNVAVVVEDVPTSDQLEGHDGTLLGLFEGVSLAHRSPLATSLPDRISIFRRPLCETAYDEEDLSRQVRVTVLHEVGHYFGMSEEQLRELGWA